MIALYLLLWLVFIAAEVYRNYRIIEINHSRPSYLKSFVVRGMAAIMHGVLFNPVNMHDYWPVLIYQVTSFWVLFDLSLNWLRQKPMLYMGKQSGLIDKAFNWIGSDGFLFFCKVLAVVVCVFSIIVIYTREP